MFLNLLTTLSECFTSLIEATMECIAANFGGLVLKIRYSKCIVFMNL